VRSLFFGLLGYFLTPFGLVLMGVLDASVFFFLPLGIDFVAILMTARRPDLFWVYAILATIGSVAGAALTFWMGHEVGEHGLRRFIPAKRLKQVHAKVSEGAAVGIAALAIVPPPFPFTPFVLTSGALGMDARTFLTTLAGARLLRFGAETVLAHRYGRHILRWMHTPIFKGVVGAFIVLAVVGTIVSLIALIRSRPDTGEERPRPRMPRAATDPR
jgi:membrane protein YqaA with SNARE-associated domain